MGPGEHRPHDEEYWTAPWSTALFAGDLFEAIPFGDQPTTLYRADNGKHFVAEVGFGYGLLTTPTCDMADQGGEGEERGEEELRAVDWPPSRYDGDMLEVSR